MALKSKTKFKMLVDPDDPCTLILMPVEGEIEGGSIYTVSINDLELEDGSTFSSKETFLVAPTENFFVSVDDVKELVRGLNLPDESIIRHIVDASKTAMYWAKQNVKDTNSIPDFNTVNLQEDYYPFYMFVKYHATVDALKEFYIELISGPEKWRDMLSDIERQEEFDFGAIKAMIDDLEKIADEWIELVVTITADPKWALRGKYCYSTFNTNANPYHRTQWGMSPHNRDYNRGF